MCRKVDRVVKRRIRFIPAVFIVCFIVLMSGGLVRIRYKGRIAPGIRLCGWDVSGMTVQEVEEVLLSLLPELRTELKCQILPEMKADVERAIQKRIWETEQIAGKDTTADEPDVNKHGTEFLHIWVSENELALTAKTPMVRILSEETIQAVVEKNNEVKVWEWFYAWVTGRAFQTRQVEAVVAWEKAQFGELVTIAAGLLQRDKAEATVKWENDYIAVTESKRGFRLETEAIWEEFETVTEAVEKRIQMGAVDGLVLRFALKGTVLMPRLSTSQAKKCDTIIGEFSTGYQGAGSGRVQNIAAGASHLHATVILPGEVFSTAAALMPFTKENGYTAGGTFIEGQLSESIGGGVCQLSTTLYNALLQTKLQITERKSHSMPVGYIPPGRDAAIAGDYKDLKFKNTTKAPVILLCKATGDKVTVTLYGMAEAKREAVTFESIITEKTETGMTVEVYRAEKTENGAVLRGKISTDRYRYMGE